MRLLHSAEQTEHYPWVAAWRIARMLCPAIRPSEVMAIVRPLRKATVKNWADNIARSDAGVVEIGFSYYDQDTFFHRRHVSNLRPKPAEQLLPPQQLQRLREALGRPGPADPWREFDAAGRWHVPTGSGPIGRLIPRIASHLAMALR